jgi:hypothetical protein
MFLSTTSFLLPANNKNVTFSWVPSRKRRTTFFFAAEPPRNISWVITDLSITSRPVSYLDWPRVAGRQVKHPRLPTIDVCICQISGCSTKRLTGDQASLPRLGALQYHLLLALVKYGNADGRIGVEIPELKLIGNECWDPRNVSSVSIASSCSLNTL